MMSVAELNKIRRAEKALSESRALRQALLDSALDSVIWADKAGRITEFNAAAERTFRISKSAAVDRDLVEIVFPCDLREHHRRELLASIAPGMEVIGKRLETRAARSDGSEFPAEFTVSRIVIRKEVIFTVCVRDITARKRAEDTVVRLAAIVESSQDAIYGGDMDGTLRNWNKGAEQIYGYSAEEVIGKSVSILIPPGRADDLPAIKGKLIAGLRIQDFESVRVAKDGRPINVSLTVSPVLDYSGKLTGISAIARDITARKLAEEALRKATETSVYASPVPIIALDTQNRVTIWNPAAERVFGWSEAEVLGRPDPIVPENADDATVLFESLRLGETLTGVEVLRRKRDGSLIVLSLSATPLWDNDHKVRGIIKFLTDITEHKNVEQALRRAEEKYRSIFENAVDGIYQTTPDGKYVSANPALVRMLGFDSADDLIVSHTDIGQKEYVDPERRAEFVQLMEQYSFVQSFEYQVYRKDRKIIWVSENAHVVRNAEGRILYFEGTVQDITQQRELEQQLRHMQKIEAIGRLAGGVAHDFNNILMAISSFAELLYGKMPPDESRKYVDEIVKATDRAASLTQSLLAFSRKQVLAPRVIDLNALIAEQADMLKRLISENIQLRFAPGAALGRVKADPGQIQQLVMNLVINARDAMSKGGEIVIETSNAILDQAAKRLEFSASDGNYVLLTVTDNGCGMDSETQSHIFEPFFTTKEQGKGTGLGLATVFGIVQQSSGHISVRSEPDAGTTFTIYLPRVEEAVQPIRTHYSNDALEGNETVLLVEDEEAVRKSAAEYLEGNGYTVLVASCGLEAVQIAERRKQPIHLLLSDVVMPAMSGRDLAEQIKCLHPETKIVFMSGYSNNLLSNPLSPGQVLLQKPFRLAALGRCIRETLNNQKGAAATG